MKWSWKSWELRGGMDGTCRIEKEQISLEFVRNGMELDTLPLRRTVT